MCISFRVVIAALFLLASLGCTKSPSAPVGVAQFVTDYGMGPDKWATAWFLSNIVDPSALITVTPVGKKEMPEGILFDVEGSSIKRSGNSSSFEQALLKFPSTDPTVLELSQIIRDIEIEFWAPNVSRHSAQVEKAYRELQRRNGSIQVPPECYIAFFNDVYSSLKLNSDVLALNSVDQICIESRKSEVLTPQLLVPEIALDEILDELRRGKKVVFIDVREPDEFAEKHIPGAINLSLRNVDQAPFASLRQADYVVTYCIKDFRGYEMAKRLREKGQHNTVILRPYGLAGWAAAGLPIAGKDALSETTAMNLLTGCTALGKCLELSVDLGTAP